MRQFFTRDFLIYKKDTRKPQEYLPIPPNIPMTLFILKTNYSYNHVKELYLQILQILQIWKYFNNPFSY